MTDVTPRLQIPFMSTAQVQKEATFNEFAALVDALIQLNIIDKDLTAPPASPADGDVYIIAPNATGSWVGLDNHIAYYIGGWHYVQPRDGWLGFVDDEGKYYRFRTTDNWQPTLITPIDHLSELSDVDASATTNGYVLTWDTDENKFTLQPVARGTYAYAELSDVDVTGLADGYVMRWSVASSKFVAAPFTITKKFTDLTDVPNAYTNSGGKGVRVNAAATALEFYTIVTGATTFTGLSDTPNGYGGLGGMPLRVKSTEDRVEAAADAFLVPKGGNAGQSLVKTTDADGALGWATPAGGGGGATNLSDLGDVDETTAPTDKQALVFDQPSGKWKPGNVAASDGGGGSGGTVVAAPFLVQTTGTGVSQNITLPVTGLAPSDVFVFVNGLKYETTEYTITDTTLTLTTNAANDAVEITRSNGSSGTGWSKVRIVAFATFAPAANEVLSLFLADVDMTLPANLSGSVARCLTFPSANYVVNLNVNGTIVGTITISATGAVTFTTTNGAAVQIAAGAFVEMVAPATPDTQIANFVATIVALVK